MYIVVCGLCLANCSRPVGEKSYLKIETPDAETLRSHKIGASNTSLPASRKVCYAVNITASDIPPKSAPCTPALGVFAGFIQEGGTIELEVPRGSGRQIDLYMYLLPQNNNGPCPQSTNSFAGLDLASLFLVGTQQNLDLSQDTQTVTIDVQFPGLTQHIGQQMNLPSSCVAQERTINKVGFSINTGSGFATHSVNGNPVIQLKARIGLPYAGQMATGPNIKLNGTLIKD